MIIAVKKLMELVDLKQQPSAEELYDRLTFSGSEGESITTLHELVENVIAAEVVDVEVFEGKKVRKLMINTGAETVQVAAGDPSVSLGEIVAYAPPGTAVGGIELGSRSVAGIESAGMLVSQNELGISGADTGVWRLDAAPGTPAVSLIDNDTLLEFGITPNRGDCFSYLGLARETAVLYDGNWIEPESQSIPEDHGDHTIVIEDNSGCPYYLGIWIDLEQTLARTADSIEALIGQSGMRSIDTLVDLTNYVMLELGQPMHAFDADKIAGTVCIRTATAGESLTTLDGETKELQGSELIIADDDGPIALAGVMGGARTEVTTETKRVLLESAHFDPVRVSRARRQHNMSSEASMRFERGVDPNGVDRASGRFLTLLADHCQYKISGISRAGRTAPQQAVEWDQDRAARLLGDFPAPAQSESILCSLGLTPVDGDISKRTIPSWRFDIGGTIDLAEEIARIWGYDQFHPTLPLAQVGTIRDDGAFFFREQIATLLVSRGYLQGIHLSFQSSTDNAVVLQNPLGKQTSALRTNMISALLHAMATNHRHQEPDIRLFEIGKVFTPDQSHVREQWKLAIALSGTAWPEQWHDARPVDFYDLKGDIEWLFSQLGISNFSWRAQPDTQSMFHPGRSATLLVNDQDVGTLGPVDRDAASEFGLIEPTICMELSLDSLVAIVDDSTVPVCQPLPRFPNSDRDLAFIMDKSIEADSVITAVKASAGPLLKSIHVFDVYEGKGIEENQKSVGCRMIYGHQERTLDQSEVDQSQEDIIKAVAETLGGTLR